MKIITSGHQMKVGQALQQHAEEKLNKISNKYVTIALNAKVIFEKKDHFFKAEIILHEAAKRYAFSTAETTDAYKSFDAAFHKVEKQLHKYKEQMKNHNNKDVTDKKTLM
jgi:ribosomal subunit interface protein